MRMYKENVCHCLISGGFGGIERQVYSLANLQRKSSCVGVLFAMEGGPFAEEMVELDGVSSLVLGLKNGMSLNPLAIHQAKEFMAGFDVVHLHSFNYVIVLAAVFARKKVVYTFHGLTHLRRDLKMLDKLKFASLKFCADRIFSQLTTVSVFMRDKVVDNLDIRKKIHVIPNSTPQIPAGRSDTVVLRKRMGAGPNDFLVLTYSRLVHNKRVNLLLDLAKLLRTKGVANIKYAIIGDGPHKPVLVEQAKTANLHLLVNFLPFEKNIFDYISAADLCLFPSHQEPFGIVALEAMAQGKVTLVLRDGGGLVEVVEPVREGEYVAEDLADMAFKLKNIAENPRMLLRDSEAFRLRAAEFEAENIAGMYGVVYAQAISE